MPGKKRIGIYLRPDKATVCCVNAEGKDHPLERLFEVTLQPTEQDNPYEQIAGQVSEQLKLKEKAEDIAITLDCSYFLQNKIHSEFQDIRQVRATIRYDAEEVLSTDVSAIAVAFRVIDSDESGSQIELYSIPKEQLQQIIRGFQSYRLDPVIVEPDIESLYRLLQMRDEAALSENGVVYSILSQQNGYLLYLKDKISRLLRSFPINPQLDRSTLFAREIPFVIGARSDETIDGIYMFDSSNTADLSDLKTRLDKSIIATDVFDMFAEYVSDESIDPVDAAIAYATCLWSNAKESPADFRTDFMPYQGRRKRIERTVKILSIAAGIVFLAMGVYFQMQSFQVGRYRRSVYKKLREDYSAAMMGKSMDKDLKKALRNLQSTRNKIKSLKSGLLSASGEDSVPARFTLMLKAINDCADRTDINVEKISITTQSITFSGDTSSRNATLSLFEAIKKVGFEVGGQRLSQKDGRDVFSVSVMPQRGRRRQ